MHLHQGPIWHQSGGAGGQGRGQAAEKGWREPSCHIPCLRYRNPLQQDRLGGLERRQLCRTGPDGPGGQQVKEETAVKGNGLLGCISKNAAGRRRDEILPLCSTPLMGGCGALCPVLGPLKTKQLLANWREPSRSHSGGQGMEHMKWLKGWGWESWACRAWGRAGREGTSLPSPAGGGVIGESTARFSSEEQKHSKRMTGNKYKLLQEKPQLDITKKICWTVAQRGSGISILEILQTGLEMASAFIKRWSWPCLEQEMGQHASEVTSNLHISTIQLAPQICLQDCG